ncbi:hypothetical protein [Kitasatospora griseola]|uniref:hypothetical protein n=1 Tax=Kitasatospora griseola TaxID=2064 RepID=UPI0034470EB0
MISTTSPSSPRRGRSRAGEVAPPLEVRSECELRQAREHATATRVLIRHQPPVVEFLASLHHSSEKAQRDVRIARVTGATRR